MTLKRFNPFSRHDWEKAGDKIEDAAEQVGEAIKDEAEDVGNKIKHEAEDVGEELQDVAEQALDVVEEAVKKALQHLVAAAAEGTLRQAVNVAKTLAPDKLRLKILAVFLMVEDVPDKLDALEKWAKHPPQSKRALKRMIRELEPTSCGISIDIQAALLLVTTDIFEVGFEATWDTESFMSRFDDLVKGF